MGGKWKEGGACMPDGGKEVAREAISQARKERGRAGGKDSMRERERAAREGKEGKDKK